MFMLDLMRFLLFNIVVVMDDFCSGCVWCLVVMVMVFSCWVLLFLVLLLLVGVVCCVRLYSGRFSRVSFR